MNTQEKVAELISERSEDSVYCKADKIISLINREHIEDRKNSILTLEAICKKYEDFLLRDEKSYNNSVIIQDIYHDNAFFVLTGSYHLQIRCDSLCGNYVHSAYDADYERSCVKGYKIIETFTSKEALEMFTELNNEIAYKAQYGNGMTAYLLDVHLEFKEGKIEHKQFLYYIDEETGLVYKDSTMGFDYRECSSFITNECDKETYVEENYYGQGQSEDVYYPLQFGLEGLKEYIQASWKSNSLAHMYHRIDYNLTKLGEL